MCPDAMAANGRHKLEVEEAQGSYHRAGWKQSSIDDLGNVPGRPGTPCLDLKAAGKRRRWDSIFDRSDLSVRQYEYQPCIPTRGSQVPATN
jgi:hypothetical protein